MCIVAPKLATRLATRGYCHLLSPGKSAEQVRDGESAAADWATKKGSPAPETPIILHQLRRWAIIQIRLRANQHISAGEAAGPSE
jgi:hypothetical protein